MRIARGKNIPHPKKKIYNTAVTMLFDEKTINEFKKIVGKGYQTKIRELVQNYIIEYNRDK